MFFNHLMGNVSLYEKENTTIKKRYSFICNGDGICRIVFNADAK